MADKDQLQRLVYDLQRTVIREVTGHDALIAADWAEDAMEETFVDTPRSSVLRIYLDEIHKRAPHSREIVEIIETIKHLIVSRET